MKVLNKMTDAEIAAFKIGLAKGSRLTEPHFRLIKPSWSYQKAEILTSLWSIKLHYKFIEPTEDGDFMFALNAEGLLRKMGS